MKRFIISTVAALMLLVTQPVMAKEFYIEAQIGQYDVDDVGGSAVNGTTGGVTYSGNFNGNLKYDADTTFGFEVGMKLNDNMRIGFSFVDADLDFEGANGNVTGSATDGTNTVTGSVDAAEAATLFDWSNSAELMMLKVYYDFGAFSNGLTPYVGFGIGQADIDNALSDETVMSFTAGARYSISENAYIGAKVSFMEIDGPDDSLGIQYQDIDVDVFEVIIGTTF